MPRLRQRRRPAGADRGSMASTARWRRPQRILLVFVDVLGEVDDRGRLPEDDLSRGTFSHVEAHHTASDSLRGAVTYDWRKRNRTLSQACPYSLPCVIVNSIMESVSGGVD